MSVHSDHEAFSKLLINAYHGDMRALFLIKKMATRNRFGISDKTMVKASLNDCLFQKEYGCACLIIYYCSEYISESSNKIEEISDKNSHCAFLTSKFFASIGDAEKQKFYLKMSSDMGNIYAQREFLKLTGRYGFQESVFFYFRRIMMIWKDQFSPDARNFI